VEADRHQAIERICQEALEIDHAERARFLTEACGGDDTLRREADALLAHSDEVNGFLETPALEVAAAALARAPSLTGQRVGPYLIRERLGAGGMGEVYRASDTRLHRDVAVKVLPAPFAQDPDRIRRFTQEACSAGMLNHPNVITVHDVGMHEGLPYIVSELLEGVSMRDRLAQATLPARKVVDYALQIARGLAVAHDHGIVHRDLKPENLLIAKDGRVKILDFGLAKLKEPRARLEDVSGTAGARTEAGAVLGTAGYMAPEQIRAEEADHRADIFAFGAILYEMSTGRRAFPGISTVEVLNATLKDDLLEPPEADSGADPWLERVWRRCLEKEPRDRFQSAGDLAFAIEAAALPPRAPVGQSLPRARLRWIAAAATVFSATLALAFFSPRSAPAAASPILFSIPPPEGATFSTIVDRAGSMAASPDGQQLAFIVVTKDRPQVWMRAINELAARPLAGTEGAQHLFWSPDSRNLGFVADGRIKRIPVAGGAPAIVCDAPGQGTTATWNHAGVILFAAGDRIYRVPAEGGNAVVVRQPDYPGQAQFWPSFLPDGWHYLFAAGVAGVPNRRDLHVASLDSPKSTLLVTDASRAAYASGYLLYVREGTLLAQPFDAERLRVTDDAVSVAEGLWFLRVTGSADYSLSNNGVLTYRRGAIASRLVWVDRRGEETGSVGEPKNYCSPRISPDGRSLAVNVIDPRIGTSDVWMEDLVRGASTRLTFDAGIENQPIWSPDGRQIVFAANRLGAPHLVRKAIDETGSGEVLLPPSGWVQVPFDWTQDGRFIVYGDGEVSTGKDIMILPLGDEGRPIPFLRTPFNEGDAAVSPDGRWVAYASNESGQFEVSVRAFPGTGPDVKRQVSVGGGSRPRWRRDGRELFYVAPNRSVMAVPMRIGPGLDVGRPAALFQVEAPLGRYDVAPDGNRFLINVGVTDEGSMPFTVVVNWPASLKRQ
jgi:eukaryotic-like serine/threonine-protein kinase